MKKIFITFLILSMFQQVSYAAFWHKTPKEQLGNTIKKEEYPDSKDVEPTIDPNQDTLLIKGGILQAPLGAGGLVFVVEEAGHPLSF